MEKSKSSVAKNTEQFKFEGFPELENIFNFPDDEIDSKTKVKEEHSQNLRDIMRKSPKRFKKTKWAEEDRAEFEKSTEIDYDVLSEKIFKPVVEEDPTIVSLLGVISSALEQRQYRQARAVISSIIEIKIGETQ